MHYGEHVVDLLEHVYGLLGDEDLSLHSPLKQVVVGGVVAVQQGHRLHHHLVVVVVGQILKKRKEFDKWNLEYSERDDKPNIH